MRKNTAGQKIGAQMVSATDGSDVTAGTTTVYVTGDAGTQAAGSVGSGACTHEGNGYWTYAPAQAETDYNLIAFTFKNTSAVTATVQVETESYDVHDTVRLGLTSLPNAAADAAGGLVISDAGGLDADAQRADVAAILVDTGTTLDGRIPAALVGGRIDANVGAISGDATSADNLESYTDGTTPQPVNTTHWGGTAVASAALNANVTQISGDTTAADNAELFFDGTGYAAANSTIGTVTTVGATGIAAIWSYALASAQALATTTLGRFVADRLGFLTSVSQQTATSSLISTGTLIELYQGEARTTAAGNPLTFVIPAAQSVFMETGTWTAKIGFAKDVSTTGDNTTGPITGTITGTTGADKTITFEMASTDTDTMAVNDDMVFPGRTVNSGYAYRWDVQLSKTGGNCRKVFDGLASVKPSATTCP